MNKNIIKRVRGLASLFFILFLFSFSFFGGAQEVFAQIGSSQPINSDFQIVPCDGSEQNPCDANAAIEMVNRIVNFGIFMSIPLILVIVIYVGISYVVFSNNPGKIVDIKKKLWPILIGMILVLGSVLIVKTVMNLLLSDDVDSGARKIFNSYFGS